MDATRHSQHSFAQYSCSVLAWLAEHTDEVDHFQLGCPDVDMIEWPNVAVSSKWCPIINDAFANSTARIHNDMHLVITQSSRRRMSSCSGNPSLQRIVREVTANVDDCFSSATSRAADFAKLYRKLGDQPLANSFKIRSQTNS